jgi:hypothetical protein
LARPGVAGVDQREPPGAARRQPAESSRRAPRDTAIPPRPIPTRQAHAVPLSVFTTSNGWLGSERGEAPSEARERLDGSDNSHRHTSLGWGLPLVAPCHPGSTFARCRPADEFPFSEGWLGREATKLGPRNARFGHDLAARELDRLMPVVGRPSHPFSRVAPQPRPPVRSRFGCERTGSAHASLGTPQPPILKGASAPASPAAASLTTLAFRDLPSSFSPMNNL